jgi:hypothetical protein
VDPISTISGLISAASFTDGSATATGAAVVAELGQLLNKTNEVVEGLTVVAADLDTAESDIVDIEADIGDTTTISPDTICERLVALQASLDALQTSGGDLVVAVHTSLTAQQVHDYATVICTSSPSGGSIAITLPNSVVAGTRPITIINNNCASVSIDGQDFAFCTADALGNAAETKAGGVITITSTSGSPRCVMLMPTNTAGGVRWHIVYGAYLADVVS